MSKNWQYALTFLAITFFAAPAPLVASEIDVDNITIFMFYDSECPYCKIMFPVVRGVERDFPGLKVSYIQLNDSPEGFTRTVKEYNLKNVIVANDDQYALLKEQGVTRTPTFWIEYGESNTTYSLVGVFTREEFINNLKRHDPDA